MVYTQLNKDIKQIGTSTAKIAEEEQTLPRIARVRLAKLRTGYFSLQNYYLNRIFNHVDNCFPKCEVAQHEVNHIFNLRTNTTDLKVIDLWEKSKKVANWPDLIPSFNHDKPKFGRKKDKKAQKNMNNKQ